MIERHRLDELVARYELEPTLRDLYVEGPRDQALLEWLASEAGIENVVAYEIESVEIPESLTVKHGVANNNRGRVITLAIELQANSSANLEDRVACIADADFARLLEEEYETELLIWSDFTATELYLFDARTLGKYIRLTAVRRELDTAKVLKEITPILRELFLVRLTAEELGVELALVDFDRCCRIEGRSFTFDSNEYVRRYIMRGKYAPRHNEFVAALEKWRALLDEDPRHQTHGHDFIKVLHWVLKRVHRVNALPGLDPFAATLWAALEFPALEQTDLLLELRHRFS